MYPHRGVIRATGTLPHSSPAVREKNKGQLSCPFNQGSGNSKRIILGGIESAVVYSIVRTTALS